MSARIPLLVRAAVFAGAVGAGVATSMSQLPDVSGVVPPPGARWETVDAQASRKQVSQAAVYRLPTPGVPEAAVRYLSERWNLSWDYAHVVVRTVVRAAQTHKLDPLLLLAVAATESSFRHWVGNPGGGGDPEKPYGIMQVAGRWHAEKFPDGEVRVTTVEENIFIGAQVLSEYLAWENGDERRALLRYNGSLGVSDAYFLKVSRYRETFRRSFEGLLEDA